MGLGGTCTLGEDFKLIMWGASHKGLGPLFIEGIDPSRHKLKISFGNWRRARLDEMVKNGGQKDFIFHVIFPVLYPFWLKFCWLSYRTFIFSILESQS